MNPRLLWAGIPRAAKIYLCALGVVAIAGVVVVATVATVAAAAPTPSPKPSGSPSTNTAACDQFLGHLASNLGKSKSQVTKAISDAIGQTLNDEVKNGTLTQQQADAIKAKLSGSNQAACAGVPIGIGRRPEPGRPGFAKVALADYATALGISESELKQDLQSGKTVKDIAASKGMDENAFRTKLVAAVKADLDKQVADKKITQQQEDSALQRLQNGPLPLWDRTLPIKHRPAQAPIPSSGTG
jgi:uncharacterized protein YidB (DUF937 family)